MSQPVKLSDGLVVDARVVAEIAERSIAGQIEFWARLGRAVEPLLQGVQSMALSRLGAEPLSEAFASINSPEGRERLAGYLQCQPFPHYEPSPDHPGLLIRIDADGTRTHGRFIRREFKAVKARPARR